MNDKNSFFKNKLFVSAFLAMFIVSYFSAAVFALRTYNSQKSLTAYGNTILKNAGASDAGIERILDAADAEIKAYAKYEAALSNAGEITRKSGVDNAGIIKILSDIGIPQGSGDPLKGLHLPKKDCCPIKGVKWRDGGGIQKTLVGIKDEERIQGIETAWDNVVQAYKDLNTTGSNTVARIKEAGVKDDTKIAELLDAIYEPIRAADTIYDAINQAMVDFPFLGRIFGNERMNVYIGEQAPFNIVTSGGKVESLGAGEIGNPSMKVYADMGTINQLIAEEITPLDALRQGKIRYEGVGLVNAVKFKVLGVVARIVNVIKEVKLGS